jgi:DNA mismatch repair protein MutL
MMNAIQILDDQLANQIAAGEVVERPASVVKELLENAIDAGSTNIVITLEEGGLQLIKVADNGQGIAAEDMKLAFLRHATSKIRSSRDLAHIVSLGFRGEALPSIASVARVECVSADNEQGAATRLVIEGGTVLACEDAARNQGTHMIVRDLFYNTPARLKYMKTVQTELGRVTDDVNRLALAHPGIAMRLIHNERTILTTLGNGDRLQTFAAIYGTQTAKQMIPISADTADYTLTGYISHPSLTRANRNSITVIINGRFVKSLAVNQSLLQGYHTFLPIGRYPLAVLEISMHPALVDVNVHPAKLEVRFSKEPELRTLIEDATRTTLQGEEYIAKPVQKPGSAKVHEQLALDLRPEQHGTAAAAGPIKPDAQTGALPGAGATSSWSAPRLPASGGAALGNNPVSWQPHDQRAYVPRDATEKLYAPPKSAAEASAVYKATEPTDPRAHDPLIAAALQQSDVMVHGAGLAQTAASLAASEGSVPAAGEETSAGALAAEAPSFGKLPAMHWIGQLHGTYLLFQNEAGLYLVDQHAAHERINYEYYVAQFARPAAASQQVIVPLTLEYTAQEADKILARLPLFHELGVALESFGEGTFLVRAYPHWLPAGDEQAVIMELIEYVLTVQKPDPSSAEIVGTVREAAAIMCSCKASIRANHHVEEATAQTLLARLGACKQPYTCPHGRPIIVQLSTRDLAKMFKRIQ